MVTTEIRWRRSEQGAVFDRFNLLAQLMIDLHGLGRASSLVMPEAGQPVLYVRASTGRPVAVLGFRGRDGRWSYVWGGGRMAAADGSMVAAHQIAAVGA